MVQLMRYFYLTFSVFAIATISTYSASASAQTNLAYAKATTSTLAGNPLYLGEAKPNWRTILEKSTRQRFLVRSADEINYAASIAKPGDIIIVRNGTYSGWNVKVTSQGTAILPIVYMAETPGKVIFSGSTRFIISGKFNVIGGFVFNGLTQHNALMIRKGTYNRLTDNTFNNCGGKPHFNVIGLIDGAHRNRLDNNTMVANRAVGMAIVLPRDGDRSFAYSQDNRIDHNSFRDIPWMGSVQYGMPLQVGQYATEHNAGETRTLVDHNVFNNIRPESINSKSNNETYMYNVFKNSTMNTVLSLRSGDDKYVEGNYFEKVKIAVHAYGEGHAIVNNVFIDVTDISLLVPRWGEYTIGSNGKTSFSPPTGDMDIAYNTFVNATRKTIEVGRTWGTTKSGYKMANNRPTNLRIYNNILSSNSGVLLHDRGGINLAIRSNIFHAYSTASYGKVGTSPIYGNPSFVERFRLSPYSLAINRADKSMYIDVDFDGKARAAPDIGAVEVK